MRDSGPSSSASASSQASFLVAEVLCPDVEEVLRSFGPNVRIRGRILYYSDGDDRENRFAIMEVEGVHTPLIVPVDCLRYEGEQTGVGQIEVTETPSRPMRLTQSQPVARHSVGSMPGLLKNE
ncbi:MAG: hypothetical protein H6817_11860 [Phycisphaerales bacterium]|nr:hypothetical protein [Phycisphaerales bacterium]